MVRFPLPSSGGHCSGVGASIEPRIRLANAFQHTDVGDSEWRLLSRCLEAAGAPQACSADGTTTLSAYYSRTRVPGRGRAEIAQQRLTVLDRAQ